MVCRLFVRKWFQVVSSGFQEKNSVVRANQKKYILLMMSILTVNWDISENEEIVQCFALIFDKHASSCSEEQFLSAL